MTERFGIQDHDKQITQHAPQGTTDSVAGGGPQVNMSAARGDATVYRKNIPLAVIMAVLCGPIGLMYVSPLVSLLLLVGVGVSVFAGGIPGAAAAWAIAHAASIPLAVYFGRQFNRTFDAQTAAKN